MTPKEESTQDGRFSPTPVNGRRLALNTRLAKICPLELICFAWVGLIWLWEPAYLTLTVDDSFYYLQIAHRLADGQGFTFDGLNPTNGFHPLWLGPLFVLVKLLPAEPGISMRLVLTVQVVLVYLGIRLLECTIPSIVREIKLVASLFLLHFYFAKVLINGMESALVFFLMAATLAVWNRNGTADDLDGNRRVLFVGLLTGLTVLARLEAVLFALPLLAWPSGPNATLETTQSLHWRRRAVTGLAFAVPVATYLIWSQMHFGHSYPVSAAINADMAGGIFGARHLGLIRLLLLAAAGGVAWMVIRSAGRISVPAAFFALATTALYLTASPIIPIWYLTPWVVVGLLLVGASVHKAQTVRGMRWALRTGAVLWIVFALAVWTVRVDPRSYSPYLAARRSGQWLQTNTPVDSLAAGWSVGIVAAHADRAVIALDGLVNSWEYKESYLDTGKTEDFITREHRVSFLAQYFRLEMLPLVAEHGFRGVDLSTWFVARAECVEFRPILVPLQRRHLVFTILQQEPDEQLPRFGRLLETAADLCSR